MSFPSEPVRPAVDVSAPVRVRSNLRVRLPRWGYPVYGLVLNRRPVQLGTHWSDGRTTPHFTPREACPGCQSRYRIRVHCYLGMYDTRSRCPFIGLYAENAIRVEPLLDWCAGAALRGRYLTLTKGGELSTSPILPQLTEVRESPLVIPDALDVRRALEDMWMLPVGALGEEEG